MSTPAKILVLSEIFRPESVSTGYYLSEIAGRLASLGPVEVICCRPANRPDLPAVEQAHDVRIVRVGRMHQPGTSVSRRLLGACLRALGMGWHLLHRSRKESVFVVVTNPPVLPAIAWFVSLVRRAQIVLIVHDVYPQALEVAGIVAPQSLVSRIVTAVQRRIYRRSSRIVCLGRDMRDLVVSQEPSNAQRVVVIPHWAEIGSVPVLSVADSAFRRSFAGESDLVVLYVGNLGRTHDWETLMEAARTLRREASIKFCVATDGMMRARLAASVSKDGLENFRVCPLPAGRDNQGDTLAAADIVLITLRAGMCGVSVPSRMYNAMAAGRPILAVADAASELAQVVREERIGWVVAPGDAAGLAQVILRSRSNSEERLAMGQRARLAAESKYSPSAILKNYTELVAGVMADRV